MTHHSNKKFNNKNSNSIVLKVKKKNCLYIYISTHTGGIANLHKYISTHTGGIANLHTFVWKLASSTFYFGYKTTHFFLESVYTYEQFCSFIFFILIIILTFFSPN